MAGLGALLFGVLLGGSAINAAIDDVKLMSKPFRYLKDGTPVYMDGKRRKYINNELCKEDSYWRDGHIYYRTIGTQTKKVYEDTYELLLDRFRADDEMRKEMAIKNGKLSYLKYDPIRKKQITCEISTDKFIARLEGKEDGTYWKYYLSPDNDYSECHMKTEGDKGIQITQEEFDKLDDVCGSHGYSYYPYKGKCIYRK